MLKFFVLCAVMAVSYTLSIPNLRPQVNFPVVDNIKILDAIEKCLTENNIDALAVDEIRKGEYRSDPAYKNFIVCSYKKTGFSEDDGRVKIADVGKLFPKESNIQPVLEKCDSLSTKGDSPTEVTFGFFKCFQDTSPVLLALLPTLLPIL